MATDPHDPQPARGTHRALAAHLVIGLAATALIGVSLGLGGEHPIARASTGPAAGPSLVPLGKRAAPGPAAAAAGAGLPAAAEARPAAPAAAAATAAATTPAPAPAGLVSRGPTRHRIDDGRGGFGEVRWEAGPEAASAVGPASASASAPAPAAGEAELTTQPVPRAGRAQFETGAFFGLPAGWRTVYLIDASGSLIDSFASVQRELERSLLSLGPAQSYAVVFFLDGRAVAVPPGRMAAARRDLLRASAAFVSPEAGHVLPAGRADAAAALEAALALEPDTVILLSDQVDGRVDPAGTRVRLVAAATRVAAETAIHTVQFVDRAAAPADGGKPTLELMSAVTGGTHRFVGF
ncbi:vWA domain-containing protein [Phycisphaera mikurensis]|uniref:VWFA domain-containing protein n=1 Tax=Phycisphaera mikurensis (strain NBRC 102666 / KCTC 22515 / FYK2301M01) TaxID=1142394 RepID=I0IAA8_PHYMF|nr:hypothetical protein [Phycisphaera mikurensis]MBB6441804.1 hypothetical protein [Phycisphaera mikurensis]BAM02196.1 hypothetical protein PSMK_00370 [Phycisphaera mikurensis NBRC 102666]